MLLHGKKSYWAILSGILLFLGFPAYNLGYIVWVALVPLFIIIKGEDTKNSFLLGYLTGIVYYFGTLKWVTISMVLYGNLPYFLSYLFMFLLILYLGLYVGIFALLVNYISNKRRWIIIFIAPIIWTSLEFVRAHILSGFPWSSLGYSQYKHTLIIQIADITSIYGISFLIVMVNGLITEIIISKKRKIWLPAVISILILTLSIGYGVWRIYLSPYTTHHTLKIGLIQGNIAQDKKWDRRFLSETIDIYKRLTKEALIKDNSIDIIIWPEAATPFFFELQKQYKDEITKFVKRRGTYLLFGSPYLGKYIKNREVLFNSAYLLSPDGEIVSRYDKIHLVPFGEYVPLSSILFFVEKMVPMIGDFSSGDSYTVMKIPESRFGVVICFEVIFPELVRNFIKNGAEVMATITNDAWFGRSDAPYQHFSMVVFRAVENRVPFVRSANTGISGAIDIYGRIIQTTDIFKEAVISQDINAREINGRDDMTFYTKYGDIFAYVCTIMGIIIFFSSYLENR